MQARIEGNKLIIEIEMTIDKALAYILTAQLSSRKILGIIPPVFRGNCR